MSVEESKAVVAKAYEIINSGAVDRFDEVVADDCIEHEAMPGAPDRGPEAPKAAFSMFLEAFPDDPIFHQEGLVQRAVRLVSRLRGFSETLEVNAVDEATVEKLRSELTPIRGLAGKQGELFD